MKEFKNIAPEQIDESVFKLINTDWMLVTAGNENDCNTMTASWGGFGVLWFKKVVFIVIRPQRHTFTYLENNDFFTLSFLHEKDKNILDFCGKTSGKHIDKIKEAGLIKKSSKNGSIYFEQAKLVLECKKIYTDFFNKDNFIDKTLLAKYTDNDFHKMYIAEITECLKENN